MLAPRSTRKRWGRHAHRKLAIRLTPFCLALVSTLALFASPATAATPSLLWQAPEDGLSGSSAGRFGLPRSLAADSATGHIYVGDTDNQRVSEFTAWGEFIKAWGWGVATGAAKLETCGPGATPPTVACQAGVGGGGKGQFNGLGGGIAVNGAGDVFVVDRENHRVQKFDSNGNFLLMFGGEVNQTRSAEIGTTEAERNLCTAASGDSCGAGTTGTGQGQFSAWTSGPFIAVGPDETVYVGDKDRIQEFNPDDTYKGQMALPEQGLVKALAVDPTSGDLYMAFDQNLTIEAPEKPFIYRHTSSGWEQFVEVGKPASGEEFKINGFPLALEVTPQGGLYVVARQKQTGKRSWEEVVSFDPAGVCVVDLCPGNRFAEPTDETALAGLATSDACGLGEAAFYLTHFIDAGKSYIDAHSSTPDPAICPPPVRPPLIADQFASSVEEDEVILRARINSRFWTSTTYYVEYGTEPCSLGGCAKQPLPPGQQLNSKTNFAVLTEPIQLTGLSADTTYHYRFVARTLFEPGPGGEVEVKGVGGKPGEDGAEGEFTTLPTPDEGPKCSNAIFRTEASALLPDCRAYEMVSPVEKGGGNALLLGKEAQENQVMQSSVDGNRMTYATYWAFAEPEGGPSTSQYLASRGEGGWTSKSIVPPRGIRVLRVLETAASEYTAFSPDLCKGWLRHDTDHAPFAPGAIEGFSNLYSRTTCEEPPAYEAITGVQASIAEPNTPPFIFLPELQGLSSDGSCAVFRTNGRLIPEASEALANSEGIHQVYEDCGPGPELVSVLPGGEASGISSSAGTFAPSSKFDSRSTNVESAVSADGERIYWTSGDKLYVREHARQEQSAIAAGKCSEAAKACTYPVSEAVSPNAATFWKATPTGSIALFTVNGTLQRFNFATKKSLQIVGEVQGLLGASEDLARIYLVSKEDKDGGGKATAGQPNVYRYEGGSLTYLAMLANADFPIETTILSPVSPRPVAHTSRVTPDGKVLAFESRAQITGFDNRELESNEPAAEVFVYSLDSGTVVCTSCNRGGARPLGRDLGGKEEEAWVSAQLPTWQTQLLPGHPLSDAGSRLFFESYDRLVSRDTNGKLDVYEWEAPGTGGCTEASSAFDPKAGGCVYLISTGTDERDSIFLDASPSGDDVFIGTGQSLLPQDPAQLDVYDARVNGGFPSPPPAKVECEGQTCQGATSPPPPVSQSATSGPGEGNVKAKPRLCPKGRHRARVRGRVACVKAHKRHRRQHQIRG